MNKADLVKQVAERAQLDAAAARRAVDAVIDGISERLGAGEDVILTGFGKFSVVQRAERDGVNPREPGSRIRIPARRSARFTPGTQLRSAVAAGPDGQVVLDPIKLMANEPAKIVVPVADDGEKPKKPAARTRKSTAKASDEKSSGSAAKGSTTKSSGSSSSTKSSGSSSSA